MARNAMERCYFFPFVPSPYFCHDFCRFFDGKYFGVRNGILVKFATIVGFGDDFVVFYNYRSNRDFTKCSSMLCQLDGPSHKDFRGICIG